MFKGMTFHSQAEPLFPSCMNLVKEVPLKKKGLQNSEIHHSYHITLTHDTWKVWDNR
jgi:hypothetical protein